ncbi:MAG: TetR family transcriptional regulator [Gemmatimonadota bacterium]
MPRTRMTQAARKATTRDALIAAATRLFASRGIEATSLDDVAEAAGFTKGAIYASFPNKRALFDAIFERHVVFIDPAPLLRPDIPLPERLAIMGRSLAELAGKVPRETVLLDLELSLELLRNPRSRWRIKRSDPEWQDLPARFEAVNVAQGASPPFESGELLGLMGILARGILRGLAETPGAFTAGTIETLFRLLGGPNEPAAALPAKRDRKPRAARLTRSKR